MKKYEIPLPLASFVFTSLRGRVTMRLIVFECLSSTLANLESAKLALKSGPSETSIKTCGEKAKHQSPQQNDRQSRTRKKQGRL